MKGIPHLVKMHEKHAKDGLVILSVTMDDSEDEKERAKFREDTNKYLADKKPPFPTYDLDFDRKKPPATLTGDEFSGNPRVFVFNRDNQYALKELAPDYDELDKLVEKLVKQK